MPENPLCEWSVKKQSRYSSLGGKGGGTQMYNKIQKQLNKTKLKTEADVVTHRYNPNTSS